MQVSSSYKLASAGVLATLLAVVLHDFLPPKRFRLYPAEDVFASIYADNVSGGNSEATWIDQEKMHWRCDVRESAQHRFCGFNMELFLGAQQGIDLSQYSALKIRLTTDTPDHRIRIYIRNFEEGFSRQDNINTTKFNNVLVPISDLNSELTIDLREFSVAEWWINDMNVPRQFSFPNFNDVRTIGIDLGVPPQIGVHELRLESIQFVGEWVSAERWYRGILFTWVGVIVLFGLFRYVQMKRRLAQEKERLESLASYNDRLKTETERYRELSTLDKLTGALNRHGFDQVMTELAQSLSPDEPVALLILDLDHFKSINDSRGHDVGDKALQHAAGLLLANIRQSDTLARWGGEEFVVLCPKVNQTGAYILAEKLRKRIAETEIPVDPPLKITTSVGAVCFRIHEDFEEVFKRVDSALYKAKHGGRNRTEIAD